MGLELNPSLSANSTDYKCFTNVTPIFTPTNVNWVFFYDFFLLCHRIGRFSCYLWNEFFNKDRDSDFFEKEDFNLKNKIEEG